MFTAEGDLWTVGIHGGTARRLTSGRGQEVDAVISPDGRTIAFTAQYEGPAEVYTMPAAGGLPVRRTWDGGPNIVVGRTPDGKILEKLMRRTWMYWKARVGAPIWNMHESFRGPMVALVNEHTASDGEAFAYGFRALGLGKLIGTRTWGGEIWLSSSNILVDRGIATAAEMGVYGPNSEWLIEGHGVDPDVVVDDTPHETFEGHDAQLETAVRTLMEELKQHPVVVPPPPKYPNKSKPH